MKSRGGIGFQISKANPPNLLLLSLVLKGSGRNSSKIAPKNTIIKWLLFKIAQ